ncbi:hypothetical protein VPNG_04987 [Cytospora leucostoma]|uniref:RBR-type E3 ubiquitin transferase n=1 Tax=Cytospora leucostoma TaxID=1230097 RepID=A0A423X7A2_9PEZI|nr:hypothetical protein VPNG_04987 [Cytospora leucostoma]
MERIREATQDELRAITLTLCCEACDCDNDTKKRVLSHLRVLQHFRGVHLDRPATAERIREASRTELRAVLLTICEDEIATRDQALDYLRVLTHFKMLQSDEEDVENSQDSKSDETSEFIFDFSQGQLDGTTDIDDAPGSLEEISCINCEEVFNEKTNHPRACKWHRGRLLRVGVGKFRAETVSGRKLVHLTVRNGRHVHGDVSDNLRAAADLDAVVLEAHANMSADSAMALSIAKAEREDREAIAAAQAEERQATEDRELALRLERDGSIESTTPRNSSDPTRTLDLEADFDDELTQRLEALQTNANEDDNDDDGPRAGPSSSSVDARTVRPTLKQRVCAACDDHVPLHELAICPCSHEYCGGCIERIVVNAITDEASWPPRCCRQRIPAEEPHIRIFLSEQVEGQYSAKKLEMDTPDRTYCHKAGCSKFIPPRGVKKNIGTCPSCEAKTCTVCKAAAHQGLDCPDDEAGEQLLALARQEGWKQCFSCHSMVALNDGCNHMTCRCGAQFCYGCGARWNPRACTCQVFDADAHPYFYDNDVEEPVPDPGLYVWEFPQPEPRPEAVPREVGDDNVEQGPECSHEQWRRRGGPARCVFPGGLRAMQGATSVDGSWTGLLERWAHAGEESSFARRRASSAVPDRMVVKDMSRGGWSECSSCTERLPMGR